MNENSYTFRDFFFVYLKTLSISIALIMLNAPTIIIVLVTIAMFLCVFLNIDFLVVLVAKFYIFGRPILYLVALIVTFCGEQDAIAVIFYILTALQIFSMVKSILRVI